MNIEQPPGVIAHGEYGKVYHLKKSLYGLKQSPRALFDKLSKVFQEFWLKMSKGDHSVLYRQSTSGIILSVINVDDIIITYAVYVFPAYWFHTKVLG